MGFQVLRSAGSKGCFDLIAIDLHCIRLIQCKSYIESASSYKKDIERMEEYLCPALCSKELWVYKSGVGWTDFIVLQNSTVALEFPRSKHGVVRSFVES
jgi:hypothetical protein